MLGDGSLNMRGRAINTRFKLVQAKRFRAYLESVFLSLCEFYSTGIQSYSYLDNVQVILIPPFLLEHVVSLF